MANVYTQVEEVLVVRVSAGLKEWTKCLLGVVDESVDNTDAPVGHKPGGDPVLQVMKKMQHSNSFYSCVL